MADNRLARGLIGNQVRGKTRAGSIPVSAARTIEGKSMSKFKKIIVSIGVALAMMVGGAAAANAATTYRNSVYVGNYTYEIWVTVDYNWWEEVFQGKRDYRYLSHYVYCPPSKFCVI